MDDYKVGLILYWGGQMISGVNGSQYDSSPRSCVFVDRSTKLKELLRIVHQRTKIDCTKFKISLIVRYPLTVANPMHYTHVPIEDDELLRQVLFIPKKIPILSAVELYIVVNPSHQTSHGFRASASTVEFWGQCIGQFYHLSADALANVPVDHTVAPILKSMNDLAIRALSAVGEDRRMRLQTSFSGASDTSIMQNVISSQRSPQRSPGQASTSTHRRSNDTQEEILVESSILHLTRDTEEQTPVQQSFSHSQADRSRLPSQKRQRASTT